MPVIDFSNVKALEPVPNGIYSAVLTNFEYVEATSSGKPGAKFQFTIDGNGDEYDGRKLSSTKSLQPQALWSVKSWLGALGVPAEELAGPIDIEEVGQDRIGTPCRIKVSLGTPYASRDQVDADGNPLMIQGNQIDAVMSAAY